MKNDYQIIDYKEIEKDKSDSKYFSCINTLQHLLVDLCKKITNLQFTDCAAIFKNKMVAGVVNFLRVEYQEGSLYMNNFLKILNRVPDIFQKYYNLEIDSIVENINNLSAQKLFRTNNNRESIFDAKSVRNSIVYSEKHFEMLKKELKSVSIINLPEMNNNNGNSNSNGEKKNNNIFLEFIITHIECIRDLLELMKFNIELFGKLNEIYKSVYETISNNTNSFDEEILRDVIEDYEKLIEASYLYLNDYSDSEYLQNTFFPLMIQIVDDINTIKSLLKTYLSLLTLDPINSISNMLTSRKNIEQLKGKYHNIFELKIYIFFIQFYIDNTHKANILFKSYFENKKLSLLETFSEQKSRNSLSSEIHIQDEVFQFKSNFYIDKYMKKCFEENLEISYFVIMFEKEKFLDIEIYDYREMQIKNFYLSNNQMFIDSNEALGLLSIFHTNESNFKSILTEVETFYKGLYSCVSNVTTDLNTVKNNYNSFSMGQTIQNSSVYAKHKIGTNKDFLLIHKISKFMFLAVKIKEKSPNDINLANELCKDFRVKFGNLHIFKTIFSIN